MLLPHTKVTTFFYLRCFLAIMCALVETFLFKVSPSLIPAAVPGRFADWAQAVCKRWGNGIGRLYVVFSALSAGMFISSAAFLPSSFAMVPAFLLN